MLNARQSTRFHYYLNSLDPKFVPLFPDFLWIALEHECQVDYVNVIGTAGL